ncbi:MAG TPA: glycoside hydrolase family 1 protein [Candidatus Margulisiibacteriota bacterium]|nr:glycoside hydrolase family 1 protein [Candidatus Margulisiibacteriota bacterium]
MYKFPHNFFWGAATAAHQVEGNNLNNDWWRWEKEAGLKEKSGLACRHYELYEEDFALASALNHNAHRLSVEWSRIEPEEGKFSEKEIKHYKDVISALRKSGLEPVVTLHHFTNPAWFADKGGWSSKASLRYFLRFTETIVSELCGQVRFWVTINEPMVYTYQSYVLGLWPPQEKSLFKAKTVADNLVAGHIAAYRLIHKIYKDRLLPEVFVSIAKNCQAFEPCLDSLRNKLGVALRNHFFNFWFLEKLIRVHSLDFIGVNYYTRGLVDVSSWLPRNLLLDTSRPGISSLQKNGLGWDIYPRGLYKLLLRLKRYALPVFILENGICTQDDSLRWKFIYDHLKELSRAMEEGVEVLGYIYWSLIDNFEWDKGFSPRFGLIEVDYSNFKRTVRESARKLDAVCKNGVLLDESAG